MHIHGLLSYDSAQIFCKFLWISNTNETSELTLQFWGAYLLFIHSTTVIIKDLLCAWSYSFLVLFLKGKAVLALLGPI